MHGVRKTNEYSLRVQNMIMVWRFYENQRVFQDEKAVMKVVKVDGK